MVRQLPLPLTPPLDPTLDNFVAGANAEVLERLRALVRREGGESVLYLWGDARSGRSHLLRAIAQSAPDAVYLDPAGDFSAAAGKYLVAADDVDRLDESRQIALFVLINRARERAGAIVAAGSLPPARLTLREDLRTRLGGGLVYRVHAIGDDGKAEQMRAEAARRGLPLTDEVTRYLINRLPRDLTSLNEMLDRIDEASLSMQRPVTMTLVRSLVRALEEGRTG